MMTSKRTNLLSHFLFHLLLLLPTLLQALNTDGVTLLSFKYSILNDPFSVLQNWNYDDETPCSWTGVTCTELGDTNTPDMFRVTSFVLPNKQLLGSVSPSLFSIPHLRILDLSNNFFSGSLPDSLSNATQLQLLNLSANAFSGNIPSGFEAIQILDLSSNLLDGSLPLELGGTSFHYLNVSHNQISGIISPVFAEKFPASAIVDLSFNNLTGPIPSTPPLLNQKVEYFSGNLGLCGQPLKTLCSTPSTLSDSPNISENIPPATAITPQIKSSAESLNQRAKSKLKPSTIAVITVAAIAGLAIIGMLILYVYQLRKRRSYQEYNTFKVLEECLEKNDTTFAKKSKDQPKQSVVTGVLEVKKSLAAKRGWSSCISGGYNDTSAASDIEKQLQLVTVDGETHLELDTLLKASAYVLGSSRDGIVYKAVLGSGAAFVVRRIGTANKLKDFEREIQAIAKLRHPNLVRVRGFIWGNEEKLLISDYVPNGSLLCSSIYSKSLQTAQNHLCFEARLRIAKGIARGIAYLHDKKHVHGNIRPSNIVLDSECEPIITNTGLDLLLTTPTKSSSSQYHPPEMFTNHKPNPKWDVYAFGAILLELLTGRFLSVDPDFVRYTETEETSLFLMLVDGTIRADVVYREDEAVACFRLGYACVSSLPQKRPSIKEVVHVLENMYV